MIDILLSIISFVTGSVGFLYGTRLCWICGKKCRFDNEVRSRKLALRGHLPSATALYLFSFVITFSHFYDGFITVYTYSITSAILLSHLVVSMAMPELKSKPRMVEQDEPSKVPHESM